MDIGDIIFILIMGLGFLSSIGGARKKKRNQQLPKPRLPDAGSPPQPARKSRLAEARERALSQMEELLRDLEGGEKPPAQPTPEPQEQPAEETTAAPVPLTRELPSSVPTVRDGTLHKEFHDKYIQPLTELDARSTIPRSTRYLSPQSLRKAVLLREIFGPPKGLQ